MKKIFLFFSSFRAKVTFALIFSLFFVMGLSNFLIYDYSLKSQFAQIRERLKVIAQTAALSVDGDVIKSVPLNRDGVNYSSYKIAAQQLERIRTANPSLLYIYTLAKTSKPGIWQFIVDLNPVKINPKKKATTAFPGDLYNASRFPEMMRAYSTASADKAIMTDEWGTTLSGYAPIRDSNNTVVAVLGVDMSAKDVYLTQLGVRNRALLVLLLGLFLSVALGFLISSRITKRIHKLVEGTRHVASDDLEFKVEVTGHDEVSELADSFNKMALSLADSKKKLQEYFYRVVQSLVHILEAKDPYTKGHSQRVADFSKKIALEMGFTEDKAESVRRAAELHDIGKLVIEESLLNKKEKLSDDEWKIIREHPLVGESALKPILFDEEMLSIVRSHHERYDGMGYPDGIKGDKISIFAQIVSVADSYDAMTSSRAYRQGMSKEEAIADFKNNSGTQFNTQIVKAFLKVLEA
ncbi:MAG: HD-GYP domain-containing protein, partial [Candidatus Omnitrophica bacterium]|nr:HD-GYP domain-containing protein [Candidatus Omnitrophota bacterium]